ncbi:Chaperone [Oryctes borbonicus]|uniref:Chaperone n=1 Tax=Oryctes borbonicus TaxID=1629725 RepID=A0A0T6B8C2_9SCAR|nr:Chaperone [Oryctes borbonicus]
MFIRYSRGFLPKTAVCYLATSSVASAKSHYDVLGITPKATHAEIKSAYYNLSKVYHPDKNQGSTDAATKFRDITAAYEVLGNVRTRRLYDKGVFVGESHFKHQHPGQDDDPRTKFYRSREHRHRPMGRTPIYDFDEWSRAHYGATFARDMERKRREHMMKENREKGDNDVKVERAIFLMIFFLGILVYSTSDDYDRDTTVSEILQLRKPTPKQ